VRSIRVRITALATLVVGGVLVIMAIGLVASQRRLLLSDLDETLAEHNAAIVADYQSGRLDEEIVAQGDDDAIAQVVDGGGRVVAATANLAGRPPLPAPSGGDDRHLDSAHLLEDEPKYRVLSRRVEGGVVHTASPLDDIDDSQAALVVGLVIAIPTAAVLLAAVMWWLVGRTLRPVEAMRREVADISGNDLGRRVAVSPANDEISRLATTMNEMLDRVEGSVERQQRFVSDASHELRSPLARMRAELEVDLEHPETADPTATHRSVLEEAEHLERIVEDLLLLARGDEPGASRRVPAVLVDLDDIVLREARRTREANGMHVDTAGVSAAQVRGDRDALTRVVRNLAENASRHARSTIVVTLGERDGKACLMVADDGPGIPQEDHERVFERFTRLDESRAGSDGGTGLGLAIARGVIERHDGTIRVDPGHSPGARFVVELPLATS
jgi:signal transduction histidine kinase